MAELDRAAIKQRLKQCRDEAGLTQPELADLLIDKNGEHPHWRSIQNYESLAVKMRDRVPWDLLDQWARSTGTTKEWILHGDAFLPADAVERFATLVARFERIADRMEEALGGAQDV